MHIKSRKETYSMEQNYSYFANKKCEYFPCHQGGEADNFNCLFCYCPFYALGEACGGQFVMLPNGVKDCSGCLYPHLRENYDEIVQRCGEILTILEK